MWCLYVYTHTHLDVPGLQTAGKWHQKDSELTGEGNAVAARKIRLLWGEDEYFQFSQM